MSRFLYPLITLAVLYFASSSRESRGSGGITGGFGAGWVSYYLFWLVVPLLVSVLTAHPQILLVVPIAVILRPWFPDPVQWLQTLGRVRSLEAAAQANPSNVTARRDLAKIWLSQRRPLRALAAVDAALVRDSASAELHYVRGICLLRLRAYDKAIEAFVEVTHLDPRYAFGDAYLRVGDALVAQRRWDDAEDAYERFLEVQSSSVEGWYKLSVTRTARADREGARKALQEACHTYRSSPGYHRRKQLGWYVRTMVRGMAE